MEIHAMKLPLYGFYADVNVRESLALLSQQSIDDFYALWPQH